VASAHQNGLIPALTIIPVQIGCQSIDYTKACCDNPQGSIGRFKQGNRPMINLSGAEAKRSGGKLDQPSGEWMLKQSLGRTLAKAEWSNRVVQPSDVS